MQTLPAPSTVPREEHFIGPASLSELDQVLSNFADYAGSPEKLAAHLQARGYPGKVSTLRSRTTRLFDLVRLLYGSGLSVPESASQGNPLPERTRQPFAVYYGMGKLRELARFDTVVVHPDQYTHSDVEKLIAGGTRVLAYLSLGEDNGPKAPWHLEERNTVWNTQHVALAHPGWRRFLRAQVDACMPVYQGFLLDTLEVVDVRPEARSQMMVLLRELRRQAPHKYLLANRGFSLLPDMGKLVDGVLIESFSTTWEDGYRKHSPQALAFTHEMKVRVQRAGLDVYGLDYATTPHLARFARQRAARLGVPTFVSTRELHRV
ncbi:hypothetical protein [Deinococcus sp. SM5_A1]|uniref:hypothetical protein n=1 Tax=Deinococcus sp. SM5_A1 TaxID=3379094 RepID=UPI003864A86C